MIKYLRFFLLLIILSVMGLSLAGCMATYEREEYYENGQLKCKEYSRALSVKAQ